MLTALDIPAGIYRNGTSYQSQGRYYDADLMRFTEGTIRPIGGWASRGDTAMQGKARAIISWTADSGFAWTAVGTHSHLYAISRSGAVRDITPVTGFTVGRADAYVGGGYGEGRYGAGLYGTPRLGSTTINPASVWSLDTWGEYLVGTMGSTIFEWTLNTSVVAIPITNAPTAEAILVTEERIMFALGSDGDPRAIDWCDAEDNTDWTPSSTNLAGGKRLQTNGKLLCGRRVRGGSLLFTDVDVHLATYVGLPLVYSFERLATGCGAASKGAVTVVNDDAYWMGTNSFWTYQGGIVPLPCDVSDYVFSDINETQISKVSSWHNSDHGEVWWLYPSSGSTEVDRYVVFSYREGHWTIGEMDRLCGCPRAGLPNPQMVDSAGAIYNHEYGNLKDARLPFVQSGPIELGEGDRTMEVHAYIPDENTLGSVAASFSTADYPMDSATTVAAVTATAKTDLRFSARRVAVTITGGADVDFRFGRARFDVKPGSGR